MFALSVLSCVDVLATKGVCEGEELSFAAELSLDDCYRVTPGAQLRSVVVRPVGADYHVSPISPVGAAGNQVHIDADLTLATPGGVLLRALLLVELRDGLVQAVYLHPRGQMSSGVEYRLIQIDRPSGALPVADPAAIAVGADTMIACAGDPRCASDLRPGDLIMTQTDGLRPVQEIRPILVEATGDAAPLMVRPGALGNHDPLILGRGRRVRVGRSATMRPLLSLIDGHDIRPADGGHLPMVSLVVPGAPVILAGGIATDAGGVASVIPAVPARPADSSDTVVRLAGTISGSA